MYRRNKIHDLIKKKYGSYNKFAKAIGADRSAVTRWMSGSRQPNYNSAKKIVSALGCNLEDIYGPTE